MRFSASILAALLLATSAHLGGCARSTSDAEEADQSRATGSLIVNGDFDVGMEHWSTATHADIKIFSVDVDTQVVRTGSASARLYAEPGKPWGGIHQTVDRPEPGRLRLSGWVRGQAISGHVQLLVTFQSDRRIEPRALDFPAVGDFDWQQAELEFEVPSGVRSLEIGFVLYDAGTAWVDMVRLERID